MKSSGNLALELAGVIEEMASRLEGIAGLLKKERRLIGGGDYLALQNAIKELERRASDFLSLEGDRDRLAREISALLHCEPKISALASCTDEAEAAALLEAAKKLQSSMSVLKSELDITSRLLDESKRYGEMILSQLSSIVGGGTFSIQG
jgi:hypothetical protein